MKVSALLRIVFAVLLVAAIGAGLVLLSTGDYSEYLSQLLTDVQSTGGWGPWLLGAIYVPSCLLLIPGTILTLGAGFLFGVFWGTVAMSIGGTLGATAAFLVGRTLARGWIGQKVAGDRRFEAINRAVAEHGFKIVLLSRLSPLFPFTLLNYAFGLTRVSLRDYVVASWIGILPGTLLYVYIGSAAKSLADLMAGRIEGGTGHQVLFGAGLLVTVVVTVLITRIAKRALDEAMLRRGNEQASVAGEANA
jgi:uncharacterized membrane protein YdjX (TVP38/TMEM64 family)